jgi:integrase/recombinase XerD
MEVIPMLTELFPRLHQQYSSLPLLGPLMEDFITWMLDNGYHHKLIRRHVRTTRHFDHKLRRQNCRSLLDLIPQDQLHACSPKDSREDQDLASTVRLWERYLDEQGLLLKPKPTQRDLLVDEYCAYLRSVQGARFSTIKAYSRTASQFLEYCAYEVGTSRFAGLNKTDIDTFVRKRSERISRRSLRNEIAYLRMFLRFLVMRGDVKPDLNKQVDAPRIYTGEQLPRSLPWDTVRAFLRSIDRTIPMGLRDYAMFLLIATYGLRASEIVSLKFDDIHWRIGQIQVPPQKSKATLLLPLTDTVAESLIAYLRHGRPTLPYRELFLRCRAPSGILKPTAVTEAFQVWTKRSALEIPFQGPHCLRHAFATHLLRQGTPLKTIGDLLGHRSPSSTSIYIRLAVEDLRDVALSLPDDCHNNGGRDEEVQP